MSIPLISAGVNVAGSLLGLKSGNDSAKAQKQIAQMQIASQEKINQLNLEEAQKNRDFQQSTIDQNYEWNSAVNQVQRYKDAGLNPFLMMHNGGQTVSASGATGSMASLNSPDSAFDILSSAEANKQSNLQMVLEHTRQSASDFISAQKMSVENKKIYADLQEVILRTKDDHERKLVQNYLDMMSAQDKQASFALALTQRDYIVAQTKKTFLENDSLTLQNKFQEIALQYEDLKQQLSIEQLGNEVLNSSMDLLLKYISGEFTKKQLEHEIYKIAETKSKTYLNYKTAEYNGALSNSLDNGGIVSKYLGNKVGGEVVGVVHSLSKAVADSFEHFNLGLSRGLSVPESYNLGVTSYILNGAKRYQNFMNRLQ